MATIIFDFDGTIADSFKVVLDIAGRLLKREESIPPEQIERLRGMSALRIAEELRIPPWKLWFFVGRGRAQMRAQMTAVDTFAGIPAVLKSLTKNGHELYIMSSNSVQNIELFLEKHEMNNEFIKIYGGVGIFGKARVLKRIIRQNHLNRSNVYYVGDEVRDIEAAKRAKVKIISVTWGYNNAKILGEHEPDLLVTEPKQLLSLLQ